MTPNYKVPNRLLWNTAASLFPPFLSASLFSDLSLSLSFSITLSFRNQHGKLQMDSIREKSRSCCQPHLLVTAMPLLSCKFILLSRFLVQLLSAQMSPLILFLIHTLLLSPRVPTSLVSTAFSVLFRWMSQGWAFSLNTSHVLSLDK